MKIKKERVKGFRVRINMDSVIKFNSKSKNCKNLSNFCEVSFIMNGNNFKTGEHAFHFNKYSIAAIAAILTNNDVIRANELTEYAKTFIGDEYKTGGDAKKAGGKKGLCLSETEIIAWNDVSWDIQKKICIARLRGNYDLMGLLCETKNKYLLHQDNRAKPNTIWGGKIMKTDANVMIGKNFLGKIWMELRDEMCKNIEGAET